LPGFGAAESIAEISRYFSVPEGRRYKWSFCLTYDESLFFGCRRKSKRLGIDLFAVVSLFPARGVAVLVAKLGAGVVGESLGSYMTGWASSQR
jgi:hypothetical protein